MNTSEAITFCRMMHSEHSHDHRPAEFNRAFLWGIVLNALYIGIEASFGFWSESLALLADAGHNLSDVLGLLLAWGAHYLSRLPPTTRYTYGFRHTSILAALGNALLLLIAVAGIVWESVTRFRDPQPVSGSVLLWVAGLGVIVNGAAAALFLRGRQHDLNIRGAYLHMAADAGVSLGVAVSGLMINLTGWFWIDPAVSLIVALVILERTWQLLRESVDLALHAVPSGIDPQAVSDFLKSQPGVRAIHDLHIWPMSTTETALTAHLVKPEIGDEDVFLARVSHELHDRFGIAHATLQIERGHGQNECHLAPHDVV